MIDDPSKLIKRLCEIGREKREASRLSSVGPFQSYLGADGLPIHSDLGKLDGSLTQREILARYLLLNSVLDQGPDMDGVEIMLQTATSILYDKGIKYLHEPFEFFEHFGDAIRAINDGHNQAKKVRSVAWAKDNESSAGKYNLFFAQSNRGLVSIKQVMDFTMHRWGVPLALFGLLQEKGGGPEPLVDYLESFDSAEAMCTELKDNPALGLGSAIGDKALHLFAKNYVSIYNLKKRTDKGWSGISYELPLDSNAGRVLFRTGFLLNFTSLSDMKEAEVILEGKGKHGQKHIRVTNLRGLSTQKFSSDSKEFADYVEIVKDHLRVGAKPRQLQIQRMPSVYLHELNRDGLDYSVADLDDGLMHIGTGFCFNTAKPSCLKCPIRSYCRGRATDRNLITKYFT